MQLMIDLATENTPGLRLAAQFLWDHASLRELMEAGVTPNLDSFRTALNVGNVPTGTQFPFAPAAVTPAGAVAPTVVAAAGQNAPSAPPAPPFDPRDSAFRGHTDATPPAPSNVVPFVPPAPAMNPTTVAPTGASNAGTPVSLELDASGMPWDARIHQKAKGKKKGDGTWKLIKGIDPTIVAAVTQELHARMVNSPPAEVAAPSFPGALPVPPAAADVHRTTADPAGTAHAVPVPPPPAVGGVPVPPPPVSVQPASAVPVPPAPVLGVPNAPVVQTMTLRDLVSKITALRTSGRLTAEQVDGAVRAAGAPNLQTLGAMAHLVPEVDMQIDLILAQS